MFTVHWHTYMFHWDEEKTSYIIYMLLFTHWVWLFLIFVCHYQNESLNFFQKIIIFKNIFNCFLMQFNWQCVLPLHLPTFSPLPSLLSRIKVCVQKIIFPKQLPIIKFACVWALSTMFNILRKSKNLWETELETLYYIHYLIHIPSSWFGNIIFLLIW